MSGDDLITFARDLAIDTKAALAKKVDPLEHRVLALEAELSALRAQLAQIEGKALDGDDLSWPYRVQAHVAGRR